MARAKKGWPGRWSGAGALLVTGLALVACASPPAEPVRADDGRYEANVREHVEAMELGMARARLMLARRALRRLMEGPGGPS